MRERDTNGMRERDTQHGKKDYDTKIHTYHEPFPRVCVQT